LVALLVAFSAVGFRLVQVQGLSAERLSELGRAQRVRHVALAAQRGNIFDRDGNELALSVPQQTVWADPRAVDDPVGYAKALAPILAADGLDTEGEATPDPAVVAELEATIAARLSKPDAAFVYLKRKVDDATAERVKALGLRGVAFVPESKRHYPSEVAPSVLGLVGVDNEGLGGLELRYERLLSGTPGELVVERDPQGRDIPQGHRQYEPPRPGADLVLTIDQGLQFEAERALVDAVDQFSAKSGRAIVMDVRTGDILAMANVTAGHDGKPTGPDDATMRNRAITDVYEPGSTNKVITVAGAIEEGLVGPSTTFVVPDKLPVADHVFSDHDPHPTEAWTVRRILVESSNVGSILIGRSLGKERLDGYLRKFGFGAKTGIEFPGETAGLLLDPDDWSPTSHGTVPIGNGLAVTALQMLNVFATIANDGVWREPRLIQATVDADGDRHDAPPATTRRVVSPETARIVSEMLEGVVSEGTGTQAAIAGYRVAGKTGTARKPLEGARGYSGNYVASFAGFAPSDDPRLAAIVVLDEPVPIYGGVVAAPVFARVMQHALRLEGIGPESGTPPQGRVGHITGPVESVAAPAGGTAGDEFALGSLTASSPTG
ncbi:MAG TPA: penicillin-binding protein 2, partial [Acidimicrobiia bacterium]|nr:penicillin-binding protein 2 [Acidimicrobiia bacterium]